MKFLELAKQRCTTRSFNDTPIEIEKLKYILESGQVAPSACNKQPQRIIVVQEKTNIQKVEKAYKTFGAPCILIICRDERNSLIRPFDNKCSGDLDIGIVTDHMMLAAREVGIGSVMVGLFDPYIIKEEFDIPEYILPTALLFLGYPKNGFLSTDRHKTERKPLYETVMIEKYNESNAGLISEARKVLKNPVGHCGHHCDYCFLGEWCGGCRSDFNCCSFATISSDGICPNTKCVMEKGLNGCYECDELVDCNKGYYGRGNEYVAKATALFIKEYGEELYTVTLWKAIDSGVNYPKSFDLSGSVDKALTMLKKYL